MTQAQNYTTLFESGYDEQAIKLANNMSIRIEQDWDAESTIYIFDDESGIYTSGSEFRVATHKEMS